MDMYLEWHQIGGYKSVVEVYRMKDCECRKAIFKEQLNVGQPDSADALDIAEILVRMRAVRIGR
jgi:hypothetical protein